MGIRSSTMKVLLISSLLLALATADSCSDCTAVVTTIAGRLMSDESLESQKAILVGGLCPGAEDVAQCEANLPEFWGMIAALLWPGYWDPSAEWMCGPICAAPQDTTMTCDDCKMVSSGRDFPCWLLLEMIPASHRLVMPPWKALA